MWVGRAIALATLGMAFAACAAARQEADLKQVNDTVQALQQQMSRQDTRLEELSNQVLVLSDRVDAARVEAERPAVPPDLKVVHLTPQEAAPVKPAREEPPVVITSADADRLSVVDVPPAPKHTATVPDEQAEKLFRDALSAYRDGTVDVAFSRFAEFRHSYPQHVYADNALYWMGECRYDGKQYRDAIAQFARVLQAYPRSNKVPDSLFKIGLAYERLGDRDKARTAFADVVASYPKSDMADLARTHLAGVTP